MSTATETPAEDRAPAEEQHTNDSGCPLCDECEAEFIDGSYADCGCCDCRAREGDRIERAVESADITEEEAREAHIQNGTWDARDDETADFD